MGSMDVRAFSLAALALLLGLVTACGSRPVQTTDGGGDANAERPASGAAGTGGMANAGTTGGAGTGAGGSGAGGTAGTGSGVAGSGVAGSGGSAGMAGTAGGAGRGGASGMAGGAGKGGASGTAPGPECTTAADCKLFADCCTCDAIPVGDTASFLPGDLHAETAVPGPPTAAGSGGLRRRAMCRRLRLRRIEGDVQDRGSRLPRRARSPPSTTSGTCYTGACAPATECTSVTSCASCTGAGQACVSYATQGGNHHHCVTIPAACGGSATCDCLGESCVAPYRACGNLSGVKGVGCACPDC